MPKNTSKASMLGNRGGRWSRTKLGFSLNESVQQLEILSSGRLGYINQLIQLTSINVPQNSNSNFSRAFGGNWEGKLNSFMKPIMGNSSGCIVFMLS